MLLPAFFEPQKQFHFTTLLPGRRQHPRMPALQGLALLLAAQFAIAQDSYPIPPAPGLPVGASRDGYLQETNSCMQFPGTNYPGSEVPYAVAGAQFNQTSPPYYPSPWGTGAGDWAAAYAKARDFVSQLTLVEKVNLTTGVGSVLDLCREAFPS